MIENLYQVALNIYLKKKKKNTQTFSEMYIQKLGKLHDGVRSVESDATLVALVSSHLDVAFISVGYTPTRS